MFLKESGLQMGARRDLDNCSNDIIRNAWEREDLCASFEPYSNLGSGVDTSLSLEVYDSFFL